MPLIIYDTSGNEVWNSDNVSGGVVATIKTYTAAQTDTLTFPAFPGRTAVIVNLGAYIATSGPNVSVDYSLGYPRVTVGTSVVPRQFAVVVY
jgi:hypothetical protein